MSSISIPKTRYADVGDFAGRSVPGGFARSSGGGVAKVWAREVQWASPIGRRFSVESNLSPSLDVFRDGARKMSGAEV
jgi:hypothetical protein